MWSGERCLIKAAAEVMYYIFAQVGVLGSLALLSLNGPTTQHDIQFIIREKAGHNPYWKSKSTFLNQRLLKKKLL